ncbi:hypothetical protein ACHAQJ_006935 [Trichoderma viride]
MVAIKDLLALRPRKLVRYICGLFFLLLFILLNYALWRDSSSLKITKLTDQASSWIEHPITKLIHDAQAKHEEFLEKRSYNLSSAAGRYRERRERHPPPGFDKWVQAALHSDAIIVEEFFDRIYKDLAPFWGLDAHTTALRASAWHWVVKVRNGLATAEGDTKDRVPWLQLWTDLVKEFAQYLPDVDMPINYMDESRILVRFSEISWLTKMEQQHRRIVPVEEVTERYKGLQHIDAAKPEPYDPVWLGSDNSYWDLAVKTCGPDTPAYGVGANMDDLKKPAEFPENWKPSYAYQGFVQNWTAAMNPCLQPHLRQLHGTFIAPISLSSTHELIPLFGGSKLPMNNEILIPGAMYLDSNEFYSGGDNLGEAWMNKTDGIVWRGADSGGRAQADTWQHFHRQRLVDMLNATTVTRMEEGHERALTFSLPPTDVYKSKRVSEKRLGPWLKDFANAGFVSLCSDGECDFLHDAFRPLDHMPMKEQYGYKFQPDADGNSFSARFRGFLRSTSLPLKATIYAEWHDDRLQPWLHFVPLDNSYQDLYSVLEFFTDGAGEKGDRAAQLIAESGSEWAAKVLRREDMKLYVWRLLLEWARVCDENRETLGFVSDLVK